MFGETTPIFEFRGPWGVPVQIGGSIFLLPLMLVDLSGSARDLTFDAIFVAIVIGSIFLHELGHAWGCLIQGVPVRRIMLYGGGGFCEQARSATRYEQELIVAMGPIVNLTIWAVAGLIEPTISDPEIAWVVGYVSVVNLFLGLLNLLPVHPLDGGKLFGLFLLRFLEARTAMILSGLVGLIFAVVWIPAMILCFTMFGFILFFIPSVLDHWRMLQTAWRA